ncbi:MAG: ureidoglycolate lyase [Beijerinckiaceae bacterium]
MSKLVIPVHPLAREAFAPFGDVVEFEGGKPITINEGFAQRVNGLAKVEIAGATGIVNVSLFTAKVRPQPVSIRMMERHPHGSQMFYPLQDKAWLVVVCADPRDASSYRAFRATGRQGVNYAANVWHHPLLVLSDDEQFMVVDRGDVSATPLNNLEEVWLDKANWLSLPAEGALT